MPRPGFRSLIFSSAFCILHSALVLTNGCNVLGVMAQAIPQADVAPAYKGLAGQTVGVMVWTDRGSRIDFPTLQADIARGITTKLTQISNPKAKGKIPPELAGVQFLNPMSVIRFQEDHPELEATPSTEIATRLGVSRVIYLEVSSFQTRSDASIDLFKGTVGAKLEVLEVNPGPSGKTARIVYTDPDLRTTWPPRRSEGIPASDQVNTEYIYNKTIEQFTSDIAGLFVTHPAE